MDKSNPSSAPTSPRVTIKLKAGARKAPKQSEPAAVPRPQNSGKLKPGAHWADEYKERMQKDMDALVR
jgi:hypothetical protein